MKRNVHSTLAAAAVAMSTAGAAQAATLVTSGQELLGVTGIAYNGALYDATFETGACAAIFTPCGGQTPYTFTTKTDADGIADALAATTFPSPPGGFANAYAYILTPYSVSGPNSTFSVFVASDTTASNGGGFTRGSDGKLGQFIDPSLASSNGLTNFPDGEYAIWTQESTTTATPEPASAALLAAGAAAAAAGKRRKRRAN